MAQGYKRNAAEEVLIKQVISTLTSDGCTAWRQSNFGVLDAEKIVRAIAKRLNELAVPTYGSGAQQKVAYQTAIATVIADLSRIISACYRPTPEGRKGVPDILAFTRTGQFLAVEVKIGADQLSPYQIAFANDMKGSGAMFFVAKDIHSFRAMYVQRMHNKTK